MHQTRRVFTSLLSIIVLSFAIVSPSTLAKPDTGPKDKVTLLQTALAVSAQTGDFNTLIAAVLAADPSVVMLLSDNGQHTVFAPNDEAFAGLGLTLDNVGDLDQETLTTILAYHVVKGRLLATGKQAVMYPGELPKDPARILSPARDGATAWLNADYALMGFAPARASQSPGMGPPHIRLDRAAEFLIGDRL